MSKKALGKRRATDSTGPAVGSSTRPLENRSARRRAAETDASVNETEFFDDTDHDKDLHGNGSVLRFELKHPLSALDDVDSDHDSLDELLIEGEDNADSEDSPAESNISKGISDVSVSEDDHAALNPLLPYVNPILNSLSD